MTIEKDSILIHLLKCLNLRLRIIMQAKIKFGRMVLSLKEHVA